MIPGPGKIRTFASYLALAGVYLFYLPHAEFVLDDWVLFQKFEQARQGGLHGAAQLATAIMQNTLWGVFRTTGFSLLTVYGLSWVAGPHPAFYFLFGLLLHVVIAWLLYVVLCRLKFDRGLAFLAGALFVLLPTTHNPLFWFPSCGHYLVSAFWFLIYLYSAAGTVIAGRLQAKAAAAQAVSLLLAMFSGDQVFPLLAVSALGLAVCWRSRAALASALLAGLTLAAGESLYALFVNKVRVGSSLQANFSPNLQRIQETVTGIRVDYTRLLGLPGGYYRLLGIRWGAAVAVAAGLVAFWTLRSGVAEGGESHAATPASRAIWLGAGLWAAACVPVLLLRWSQLRYHYLPTLGLAMMGAGICFTLFSRSRRWLVPATAALAATFGAASAYGEIQQCWTPQSNSLRSLRDQLGRLKDVRYHDIIAVSGTLGALGTAPHFAMVNSHVSTPFAEFSTGVWGLVVGKEIYYRPGQWGLGHADFFVPIEATDLARTHVITSEPDLNYRIRTLIAYEVEPGVYRVAPLKDYTGSPPIADRGYSHDELRQFGPALYVARPHRGQDRPSPAAHLSGTFHRRDAEYAEEPQRTSTKVSLRTFACSALLSAKALLFFTDFRICFSVPFRRRPSPPSDSEPRSQGAVLFAILVAAPPR